MDLQLLVISRELVPRFNNSEPRPEQYVLLEERRDDRRRKRSKKKKRRRRSTLEHRLNLAVVGRVFSTVPTWNRTNGIHPKLHAANRKKGGAPPKNFITLQHPPTEGCFFPNDIETRSRTSRGRHAPEFGLSSSRELACSLSFFFFSLGREEDSSRKFKPHDRYASELINSQMIDSTILFRKEQKSETRHVFYSGFEGGGREREKFGYRFSRIGRKVSRTGLEGRDYFSYYS